MSDDVTNVDLFDNTNIEPAAPAVEDFTAELVGPGKKYADVGTALKALYHSQNHIERLEQNNSDLRSEIKTRMTIEEFLDKMKNPQDNTANEEELPEPGNNAPSADALTPEKVLELVRNERGKEARAANAKSVKDALIAKYGSDYVNALRVKTEQLGLSADDINEMSQTKPKAILALLGVEERTVVPSAAPPRNGMQQSNLPQDANRRNYAYYQKMFKEQPKRYMSSEVQLEMDREAQRQGSSFYT